VKTIGYGLHILINKHPQYRCLEFTTVPLKRTWRIFAKKINFSLWVQDQNLLFTFLANDYEAKFRQIAFSESVRISQGQHLPPKFFFNICFYFMVARLTSNAIPRSSCLCRFHFVGATFGPQEFIRSLKHLSYSAFVILILRKIFACLSGKLSTEFTSPIAKSTTPGLSDTTLFARWTDLSVLMHTVYMRIKMQINFFSSQVSQKAKWYML